MTNLIIKHPPKAGVSSQGLIRLRIARLRLHCSHGAKSRLGKAKELNLKRLIGVIDGLRSNQNNVDFHRLSIQGLGQERDPEGRREQAFELRHIVEEVFGCKLAYRVRDKALIIGTDSEVEYGIENGLLTFQNLRSKEVFVAEAIPVVAPPRIGPHSNGEIIVYKKGKTPLAQQKGDLITEIIRDMVSLLGRGDFKSASIMTFYRRAAVEAWDIIQKVCKVESVIDKDTIERVRLELDVIRLEGREIGPYIFLASILFENYLPIESARIILELTGKGIISIGSAIDIFACISASDRKRCALILLQMILQGGAKGEKQVDKIFKRGYKRLGLINVFVGLLDALNKMWVTGIYSSEDYDGKGSIYKRVRTIARVQVGIRKVINGGRKAANNGSLTDEAEAEELVVYEGSPFDDVDKLIENTPDGYMRKRAGELLKNGEARLAAKIVFGSRPRSQDMYLNMRYFSAEENGRMLAAMSKRDLYLSLVHFYKDRPKVYEKEQEVLDVLLEAFYHFGGETGNSKRVTDFLDAIIRVGNNDPNLRWSAYWLLWRGVAYLKFNVPTKTPSEVKEQSERLQGFYIEIVENLVARHKLDNWRDLRGFIDHKCFLKTEMPIGKGERKKVVAFYWRVLKNTTNAVEARVSAAKTLGMLRATEHFWGIVNLAENERKSKNALWKALMVTSVELYNGLAEFDKTRFENRYFSGPHVIIKNHWFLFGLLEECREDLVKLGRAAIPVLEKALKYNEAVEGVLSKEKFLRRSNEKSRINFLLLLFYAKQQRDCVKKKAKQILHEIRRSESN